jgi:rhomboid protease GluP
MEPKPPARDWVVYALIAANLAAFAYELSAGVDAISPTAQSLVDVGGNFPPLTVHGEWWRMGTAMFLHAGVLHIGLNMLCLWQGRIVERIFGHAGFAAIYIAAGLCGGVASLARGGLTVSVGASGAVFGVYGAFAAFLWLRRATIPAEIWSTTARQMATFVGINLVYGFSQKGIDMSAHIGGILGGFAAGAFLLNGATAKPKVGAKVAIVLIAGVAIAAIGVTVVKAPERDAPVRHDDIDPVIYRFNQVRADVMPKAEDIYDKAIAGTITGEVAATRLEREVLAPWRDLRAAVEDAQRPPEVQPLFEALRHYMASGQDEFEAFIAWARAPEDQKRAKADAFEEADRVMTRDRDALDAEAKHFRD